MESNNIKNLRTGSSTARAEIPDQLKRNDKLRYILIRKDEKKKLPVEKEWQIKRNYAANEPKLRGWIRGGGNYGVLTGLGSLVVFDADEVEHLNQLGVLKKLPETFTVRTGGGGLHFYYYCKGLQKKIVLSDPVLMEEDGTTPLHLGEIQAKGEFVIGPGSLHRTGKRYEIINDAEIAEIEYEQL